MFLNDPITWRIFVLTLAHGPIHVLRSDFIALAAHAIPENSAPTF